MRRERKRIKKNLKALFKPVSVLIVPHNSLPSFKFGFSFITFFGFIAIWTVFTLWSGYIAGKPFDYYVTKADNEFLRTKMKYMSIRVHKGLDYLLVARKSDNQMRKILGMDKSSYLMKNSIGGVDLSRIADFKKAFEKKADDESVSNIDKAIAKVEKSANEQLASFSEISWYLTNKHNFSKAIPMSWPAKGRITSPFGYRFSPIATLREFHSGVDIANSPGTKIYSTADGVVRRAGWVSGYGMAVLIDHGFGYSTLYAHMSEILVKEKQKIRRGEIVGKMGSTGISTGPHVHYEVRQNGIPKNPISYIKMNNKVCENISIFESIFSHSN